MKALLWTLVVLGVINTVGVIWCAVTGSMPEVTTRSRALSAIVTFGYAAWALWLLAKGSA